MSLLGGVNESNYSFKGSLTSLQAGNAVKDAILRLNANADVIVKPLADDGEATVEALD